MNNRRTLIIFTKINLRRRNAGVTPAYLENLVFRKNFCNFVFEKVDGVRFGPFLLRSDHDFDG